MESRPYRSRPQNWAWCDVISRFNAREARYLVRICPYINDKNYDYCRRVSGEGLKGPAE